MLRTVVIVRIVLKKNGAKSSHLGICDRVLQKFLEVLVPFLVLVTCLPPLSNRLAMENKDVEEGIKEENDIGFDRDTVEQDRLGLDIECVRHESGLDHN